MRVKFLPVVPAVFFLLLTAQSAHACSCMGGRALCEEFGSAAAVFVGTVTGVRDAPRPATAQEKKIAEDEWEPRGFRFAVTQSFHGVAGAEVEVWTGRGGGDCGYDFEQGATYLVYAYRMEKSGRLGTGICSRTRPLAGAAEDLEFLRGLARQPNGVTISGAVSRQQRDLEDRVKGGGPLSGASIVVEGGGERREVSTDAEGRFSLSGLKAGAYTLKLLLPEELTAWQPERQLKVADRGCAVADFLVRDNGRVSGLATDAEGKAAAGVRLTLVDADNPELERGHGKTAVTDEEGRYAFDGLPPGRYLLAVNLVTFSQYRDPTNAFPRTYYPAAARASDAEVITLGAGEERRGLDLRLPPRRAERSAEIDLVWEDGRPADGVPVRFKDVTYHERDSFRTERADEEGRLRLKGYEGQTFVVEVMTVLSLRDLMSAGPLTVRLSEQQGPLKLVITKKR